MKAGNQLSRAAAIGTLLIVLGCLVLPARTEAQGIMTTRSKEYKSSDVPKAIPGVGTITSILTIADAGPIVDLNVKLNIAHSYDADLDVFLMAPDGTRVELFTDVGAGQWNFIDTILDDEASQSITEGEGRFTGSYRPEGNLSDLYGKDIAGMWTLEVTDDWSASRAGTLSSWSLIAEMEALKPLPAPVIHIEASVPGGICDTVCWDDAAAAKEYESSVAVPIPDQGTATATLVVEGFGMIEDLNVKLDVTHELDSDLDVFLVAPDKTRIELFTDVGGLSDNFTDTILDDEAGMSITEGSAPFTGTYRPEGKLSELIGRDVHGTWTLEVTDDSILNSGTLNHWSVIVTVANTFYYAEAATDAEFTTVVANSGWITDKCYTFPYLVPGQQQLFTGLNPDQKHWYRVKARPLETWLQTTPVQFNTDTLNGTQTTENGDVTLDGSADGLGPELNVIADPSFESLDIWKGYKTNDNIIVGFLLDSWATDGDRAGIVEYDWYSYSVSGDFGALIQQAVDFTGVDTLVFDYASWAFGQTVRAEVWLGQTKIWEKDGEDASEKPNGLIQHLKEEIDISSYTGLYDLGLVVRAMITDRFDSAIMWDNLRAYGPSGYAPSGTVVSSVISIGTEDTWDLLRFNSTVPARTALTVDVLPETGDTPIDPWWNIPSASDGVVGMGLSDLANRTIRLKANLSTTDRSVTPVLHDWSLTYSDATRQSPWSNVESSVPPQ